MSGRSIASSASAPDNPPPANGSIPDIPNKIRISLDLVTAARRHLSFLLSLSASPLILPRRSIQRYEKLWMPLIADLIGSSPMILPPADVRWIWHCHCLYNPAGYRRYCALRFGTVIDRPAILDEENEDYAILRCREMWEARYPSEPFDLKTDGEDEIEEDEDGDIATAVVKHRSLVSYFADTYVSEMVYLVSAKVRYLEFLNLVRKYGGEDMKLVPVSDVLLMLLTHKDMSTNSTARSFSTCDCGATTKVNVSWTDENPGRRFIGCPNYRTGACKFFEWIDPPMPPRSRMQDLFRQNNELLTQVESLKKTVRDLENSNGNLNIAVAEGKMRKEYLEKKNLDLKMKC